MILNIILVVATVVLVVGVAACGVIILIKAFSREVD